MVGSSFAKSMAQSLSIPSVGVHHMKAHILAHFIKKTGDEPSPEFPFLCLTVSGGHTEIVLVRSALDMEKVGVTIDDAAGEAFDKAAKMLGLPYPGGPQVDKLARQGKVIHEFARPRIPGLDFSFSGVKTSILYYLRDRMAEDPAFIETHLNDLCASVQETIVGILITKLKKAMKQYDCKALALAGGVAANSLLRERFQALGAESGIPAFIPPFEFCTDNAAMIGITGQLMLQADMLNGLDSSPSASLTFD
jgi:N6-L-threonylcarbamoyladenine synthase